MDSAVLLHGLEVTGTIAALGDSVKHLRVGLVVGLGCPVSTVFGSNSFATEYSDYDPARNRPNNKDDNAI